MLSGHSPAVHQTSQIPGATLDAVVARFEAGEREGVSATQAMYCDNAPGIAWGEALLTPQAQDALRHFCLASTIWYEFRCDNDDLGAVQQEGFDCPLLLQFAEELRAARQDRGALFNSVLPQETGRLDFRPGCENRRINVTLPFGLRGD